MSEPRWTIVTGASSGIGAEIARRFSAIGHNLVLVARRRERLESLASELVAKDRGFVETMECDLAGADAAHDLHARIAARDIAPHTLVNAAGFGLRGDFIDLPLEEQMQMIALNVAVPTALCRLFLPDMIARGRGGILNVASMGAFQASPHMATYQATKAYLLSLSEALHEEAKPFGVVVTALCPGSTGTEFGASLNGGEHRYLRSRLDAKRVARIGVESYRAGHAVCVPGARNKTAIGIGRFLPRMLARRVAGAMQR